MGKRNIQAITLLLAFLFLSTFATGNVRLKGTGPINDTSAIMHPSVEMLQKWISAYENKPEQPTSMSIISCSPWKSNNMSSQSQGGSGDCRLLAETEPGTSSPITYYLSGTVTAKERRVEHALSGAMVSIGGK